MIVYSHFQACAASGTVKRVVLTSSIASVSGGHPRDKIFTEETWTDVSSKDVGAYEKSKVCFTQKWFTQFQLSVCFILNLSMVYAGLGRSIGSIGSIAPIGSIQIN